MSRSPEPAGKARQAAAQRYSPTLRGAHAVMTAW